MKEAELVFAEIFNCDRASLYLNKNLRLDKEKAAFVSSVLKRRSMGEPLAYILGKTEFMGLEFRATPDVLIPRPETEILVEKTIEFVTKSPSHQVTKSQGHQDTGLKILDLGTGSGCIAVSLAKFLPKSEIDAIDISEKALVVARFNAAVNKVKINFMQGNLFAACVQRHVVYDLIVSNPPYVATNEIDKLQVEVKKEPCLALNGGRDGLDFYRRIIEQAPRYLKEKGHLILEIGFEQVAEIKDIFQKSSKFEIIEVIKDYNDIDRVVVARRIKNG